MSDSQNTYNWFFATTRHSSDVQKETVDAVASQNNLSRQTMSLGAGCSDTLNPASAMADQPGMIAMGGYGQPGGGCKVDDTTELRWGIAGAHREKGPKQLWARPFATTPNLRGGKPGAVDSESTLIRSAPPRNKKENSTIMDKMIPNYYQPLIESKSADYKNVNHWVESWTRGGDSARLVGQTRGA